MDASSPAFDADALLAEAGHLHALARDLARDAHTADDLVQDTLLTALERPPRRDEGPSGLRGWLATVLRNRARQGQRSDHRRRAREERVARHEATEVDAGDVEARMLLLRRLADAIAALPEPQRSAVTMRWIDGRTPAEIARAQGTTPEAARQRLSRATAMLRDALDRDYRGRAQWSMIALVMPPAATSIEVGTASAWKGITMSTTAKIAASAVLVALVVWIAVRPQSDAREPARQGDVDMARAGDASTAAPKVSSVDRSIAGASPLDLAHAQETARASAEAASTATIASDSALRGVVLDPFDRPVAGARIEVRHSGSDGYQTASVPTPMPPLPAPVVAEAKSADDGTFEVAVPAGRPHALDVHANGFAAVHLGSRYAGERVVVHLSRGASIHGMVTHKSDGTPAVDALVHGFHPRTGRDADDPVEDFYASTDGDGRYAVVDVMPGSYWIEVRPKDALRSKSELLALEAGADVTFDVAVDAGRTVKGRVTDAVTGAPIAGALVGESFWLTRFVRTDRDGRYEYPGFPGHDPNGFDSMIGAAADGYAKSDVTVSDPSSEPSLDLQLQPGNFVRCRIVDRAGRPVAGAAVAAWAYGDGKKAGPCEVCNGASLADGKVEIGGLRSDLPHVLVVRKEGFGTALRDFPADERNLRVVDMGDVAVDAMATVSGTVVDAQGTALAGRSVTLVGSNSDRSARAEPVSANKPAVAPPIDRFVAQRVGRTDDQGRFAFADVAPGDYRVRAFLDGVDDPVEIPAHVGAAERVAGLKLVLDEGLSIEGRVFGPDGNPVEKASVTTHFTVRDRSVQLHSETDAQGRFRLVGLSPGARDLSVLCWNERQETRFAPTEIKAVQAGTHDVVVRLRNVARIEGFVREYDGTPVPFAIVHASLNIRGVTPIAERGQADGSFFIDVAEGDVVDLSASISAKDPVGTQPQTRQTAHVPRVASGTKGVVLRFPPR